ncbi:MAG TPA: hypothetical protein VHE55_12960 [Fimbriimonadaceae bacterium]|nr:hypothetical protein [Fimbriimonadaceae bacterium]
MESINGLIDFALGKTVILTTKSKRRMAVLEIKALTISLVWQV